MLAVIVDGGLVQEVVCDDPKVLDEINADGGVIIVDKDVEGSDADESHYVKDRNGKELFEAVCRVGIVEDTELALRDLRTTVASLGQTWVAYLSDGERAFPVCVADTDHEAVRLAATIVGDKEKHFISARCVPTFSGDAL